MVKIKLLSDRKVVQETLSRMGIGNFSTYILYPSAYLISLEDGDFIAHFKELFRFINKEAFDNMAESDYERLNSICFCVQKWGLIECLDDIEPHKTKIDCIRFEDKKNWIIKNKIKVKNLSSILG